MNQGKTFFEKLQALPGVIQDYLFNPKLAKINTELLKKFKIAEEKEEKFFEIINSAFFKEIEIKDLPPKLQIELGQSEKEARDLAVGIAGSQLLPIEDFLGENVEELIRKWGGDPREFPQERITIRKISVSQAADEVLNETGVRLAEERMTRRLREVIISRLKDVRDDSETKNILMRNPKVGGLSLGETDADTLIDLIHRKTQEVQIVAGEIPLTPPLKKGERPLPFQKGGREGFKEEGVPPFPKGRLGGISETEREEEAREVAYIAGKMEKTLPLNGGLGAARIVDEALGRVLKNAGLRFTDADLQNRCINIVISRLKDVRDTEESRSMLLSPPSAGGLGFSKEQTEKIVEVLEKEFSAVQTTLQKAKEEEAKRWREEQALARAAAEEERKKKEKEETEKRFEKITSRGREIPLNPPLQKGEREKSPLSGGQPPKSPLSGGQPPESPLSGGQDKTQNNPRQSALAPHPPTSSRSGTRSMNMRPPVEDIKHNPKLIGPVEEIRRLTLEDWRRLSPNPKEAVSKIQGKIELLGQESFKKKAEGISAWKQSAVNRLYLEILAESLSSPKNLGEVIRERETTGKPVLTLDEFHAIMELNKNLRF